jgi:hypothetical protein
LKLGVPQVVEAAAGKPGLANQAVEQRRQDLGMDLEHAIFSGTRRKLGGGLLRLPRPQHAYRQQVQVNDPPASFGLRFTFARLTRDQVADVRAQALRVTDELDAARKWWPDDWARWRPDPKWPKPAFPYPTRFGSL